MRWAGHSRFALQAVDDPVGMWLGTIDLAEVIDVVVATIVCTLQDARAIGVPW